MLLLFYWYNILIRNIRISTYLRMVRTYRLNFITRIITLNSNDNVLKIKSTVNKNSY